MPHERQEAETEEPDVSDLSISVFQEVGWILEYAIVDRVCSPLLECEGRLLVAAIRRASALLFINVGETLHKEYAGPPLCRSWDELVCHRHAMAHYVAHFRGEWTSRRMKEFADEHGHSSSNRRLRALWDLARWFDEQAGVPPDSDLAWGSGAFFTGERAKPIAAMCNGVLVGGQQEGRVAAAQVEAVGRSMIDDLELARAEFRDGPPP